MTNNTTQLESETPQAALATAPSVMVPPVGMVVALCLAAVGGDGALLVATVVAAAVVCGHTLHGVLST